MASIDPKIAIYCRGMSKYLRIPTASSVSQLATMKMTKSENIASYFMRIVELRDKLKYSGDNLEEKDLIMTSLNSLPVNLSI